VFQNIEDASLKLLETIGELEDKNWLLVAISESGEQIAKILSKHLQIPNKRLFLEPVFCQKNSDCEIAMVSEFKTIIIDDVLKEAFQLEREMLLNSIDVIYDYKLMPRVEAIRGNRDNLKIGETVEKVILVDEAVETGLRMETAIATISSVFKIESIYIATPIIPQQMVDFFEPIVEKIFRYDEIELYTEITDYYIDRESV
jgi:predicted phosphoribosyltransferase